jgi:transposase
MSIKLQEELCLGSFIVYLLVGTLQLIYLTLESVEEYSAGESQKRIAAPIRCPNCRKVGKLRALGYYHRYSSKFKAGTLEIQIRRFRCFRCHRTTSFLPSFLQPYRLVVNETIEAYMAGNLVRPDILRAMDQLKRYNQQYMRWLPELRIHLHKQLLHATSRTAEGVWGTLLQWGGGLALTTLRLTRDHQITMFGQYKCHLPNPP